MTALDIRALTASYGAQEVLRGLDLRIEQGVTAIVGPSGCGKTTLLRTVAGFVTPTSGTVAVAGRTVVGDGRPVPARARGVGYVPQEGALFPHLDVAANIGFGLPRAERRTSARIGDLLELVELPAEMAGRFPHQLSGGQQQRVAVARALAPAPALVLLDEPFSSLDAGLREETGRAVVRALAAAGAAALLVTHDQGEALSLADQVAVMAQGRFLQVGSPPEVYLSPASAEVAGFLGHAAMLTGTIDGATVTCALGRLALRAEPRHGALEDGAAALVAVRAEQVQVLPHATGGGGDDAVAAEVLDVSFFGHDATIRVRLGAGEEVVARTPADAVPRPGDRVCLRVTGAVVAFPEA